MIDDDKPEALEDDALEAAGGGRTGENLYVSGADPAMNAEGSKTQFVGENLYISSQATEVWSVDADGDKTAFAAKTKKT